MRVAGPASYRAVLTVVAGSTFLSMLAYSGPLGNVITLAAEFGAGQVGVIWILASMSAGLAVTLLAAGVLADRIGHGRVFLAGAAIFVLANAVCALSNSTALFVAARIVAGVGAAGMIATGLGLVAAVTATAHQRATSATWWSIAMGAGIALGPLATGALDLAEAWRAFYAALALGGTLIGAGLYRLRIPAAESHSRPFDALGFVLLTMFLGVAVAAIVEIRAGGAAIALPLFAAATLLLLGLALSQRFGRRRLIDPALFTHAPFLAATSAGFGAGLGVIAVMSFACSYLVAGLGMTTFQAALNLAAWSGTSAVAALVFSRLSARIPGAVALVVGLLGVAAGIALTADLGGGIGLVGLFVTGVAFGLLNTGLARESVATVPPTASATGTAANNSARYLGSSIGVSAASIIAAYGDPAAGWERVAWSGAAVSVVAALAVGLLSLRAARRG